MANFIFTGVYISVVAAKERLKKMQVNNNVHSPNFGMASWFTKKGAKLLVDSASESLNKRVERVADKVVGTKTYGVEFTTDEAGKVLVPRVVSPYANKYLPPYKAVLPHDEFLTIHAKWDGTKLGGDCVPGNLNYPINLRYSSAQEALKAYSRVIHSDFDAAAEIATKLEEAHIAKLSKEQQEKAAKEAAQAVSNNLIAKFGIKA